MSDHARAQELSTWMVNGRLKSTDGLWLNEHLADCAACRNELAAQQLIRNAIAREPTVEFAPQASFNRLWKQIEADANDTLHGAAPASGAAPMSPANTAATTTTAARAARRRPADLWMRVALVAQAAAIVALGVVLWARPAANAYRTVTDLGPSLGTSQPVVKVIFDDQVRLAELKDMLRAAELVVAVGPSEAGVYSLVPLDGRATHITPVMLARLRADPRVRFAEISAP